MKIVTIKDRKCCLKITVIDTIDAKMFGPKIMKAYAHQSLVLCICLRYSEMSPTIDQQLTHWP